jgi:hypothetical protein
MLVGQLSQLNTLAIYAIPRNRLAATHLSIIWIGKWVPYFVEPVPYDIVWLITDHNR